MHDIYGKYVTQDIESGHKHETGQKAYTANGQKPAGRLAGFAHCIGFGILLPGHKRDADYEGRNIKYEHCDYGDGQIAEKFGCFADVGGENV